MSTLLTSLNASKNRSLTLILFIAAASITLGEFPEAYSALCLYLEEHPSLSPLERTIVRRTSNNVITELAQQLEPLTSRVYEAWERLGRWKKLKEKLWPTQGLKIAADGQISTK